MSRTHEENSSSAIGGGSGTHRKVDDDCPRCEEGPRVRMDHEIVCEACHETFGGRDVESRSDRARRRQNALYGRKNEFEGSREPSTRNRFGQWSEIGERDTYEKSGNYKMFGGFTRAYEGDGEYELDQLGDDNLLSIR